MGCRHSGAGVAVILLLALSHGFTYQALAQSPPPGPCPASCDANKLQKEANDPMASATDIGNAVKVTLDTILDGVAIFGDEEAQPIAKGVKTFMDAGFSLWSAWNNVANPQPNIRKSLHNDMVMLQDYLVCKVDSIVTASTQEIEKEMKQTQLNTFNAFMNNAISTLNEHCGALNCLNASMIAPSKRNDVTGTNCVIANPSDDCAGMPAWNPMAPRPCTSVDPGSGEITHGICDPDGQCYSSSMSRSGAQAFYAQLSDKFNSGNINNLFGLDQFPPGDTEALVLASKMSLMQINLLQQLIMAGSTRGENTTLRSFAGTAANWMQARYDFLVSIDRFRGLVSNYSTITNGTQGNTYIRNPRFNGAYGFEDQIEPYSGYGLIQCRDPAAENQPCYLWVANYGSYQLAYSCDPAKKSPVYQQTEQFCYWANASQGEFPAQSAPCSVDSLPYGLPAYEDAETNRLAHIGVCEKYIASGGYCSLDSSFPGRWLATHNEWLAGNFTAAKEKLAQELAANMTTALVNIKGIIDDLRKLNATGMPQKSLNAFAKMYPFQKCDNGATGSATGAPGAGGSSSSNIGVGTLLASRFLPNAAALLKGDGAVPLPDGAVITPTTAPAPPPPQPTSSSSGGAMPPPASAGMMPAASPPPPQPTTTTSSGDGMVQPSTGAGMAPAAAPAPPSPTSGSGDGTMTPAGGAGTKRHPTKHRKGGKGHRRMMQL